METVFAVFIAAIALVAGFALKGLKKSVRREIRRAFSPAPDAPPKNLVRPPRFDVRSSVGTLEQREVKGTAYVVDGDTIIIQKTQIRLFGIDAPEIDHPYGQKAKWALVSLCKGKSIRADITDMDRHGRTVAKCYLPDGRDLSEEMVKMEWQLIGRSSRAGSIASLKHRMPERSYGSRMLAKMATCMSGRISKRGERQAIVRIKLRCGPTSPAPRLLPRPPQPAPLPA